MGFGHRVYKNYDPRANVLRKYCHNLLKESDNFNLPLFKLANKLEEIALNDSYFIKKKLYPNVDFYSGILYKEMDIPTDIFTPIFAMSRVSGWLAHWIEQIQDNKIFRPTQNYVGSDDRAYIDISNR